MRGHATASDPRPNVAPIRNRFVVLFLVEWRNLGILHQRFVDGFKDRNRLGLIGRGGR